MSRREIGCSSRGMILGSTTEALYQAVASRRQVVDKQSVIALHTVC
jgi:hypothetical protein